MRIPVFRPKGPKTIPFGAVHTYMVYMRGVFPSREIIRSWKKWKDIDSFNIISYFSCLLLIFARFHLQGLEGGSMAFVLSVSRNSNCKCKCKCRDWEDKHTCPLYIAFCSGLGHQHTKGADGSRYQSIYEPTEPSQPMMSDDVSDEDRPQHRELRPLLFSNSVWVL